MKTLIRIPASQYKTYLRTRNTQLVADYRFLVNLLGEPHKNADKDFPDNADVIELCWGITSEEDPDSVILIWSYPKDDPTSFSVYYNNKYFYKTFHAVLEKLAVQGRPLTIGDMSTDYLISIIASMHDTIQHWDQGYGLQDDDAQELNKVGSICLDYHIKKEDTGK